MVKTVKWADSVKDNERIPKKILCCTYCRFRSDDPVLFHNDHICKTCKKYDMIKYFQNRWKCQHEDCLSPGCMSMSF